MKTLVLVPVALLLLAGSAGAGIATPPPGKLYHGVYPGGVTGEEDDITPADLTSYESTVGQDRGLGLLLEQLVPEPRLPARDRDLDPRRRQRPVHPADAAGQRQADAEQALHPGARSCSGDFDADFRAWGDAARDFGTPLLVEFGTEMNGSLVPLERQVERRRRRRARSASGTPSGASSR